MSVLTVGGTGYAVRSVDLEHDQIIKIRRAYSGRIRTALPNGDRRAYVRKWIVETEPLPAADADALEAVLTTVGGFDVAGDVPGSVVSCRAVFPITRTEHLNDYAVLRFVAQEVGTALAQGAAPSIRSLTAAAGGTLLPLVAFSQFRHTATIQGAGSATVNMAAVRRLAAGVAGTGGTAVGLASGGEPPPGPILTYQNFLSLGENGWWTWGNYAVGTEDGRSVGMMVFPAGVGGGANGGGAMGIDTLTPVRTFDITFDIKFSANWIFHSVMNKIGFINSEGQEGGGNPIYLGVRGNSAFSIEKQGGAAPDPSRYYQPNLATVGPIVQGTWYTVRARLVMESSSNGQDGSVELWVNGTKTTEYTAINIDYANGLFSAWAWNPVYGGTGGSSAAGQTMFMDNVVIRGS